MMFTVDERAELKKRILNASIYYGKKINLDVAEMYVQALDSFSFTQVSEAINFYAKNPKNKFMFLAADLIEIIDPQPSEENLAREIASRITSAVSTHGWVNAKSAKEFIGEIGWKIVERKGGWSYICENLGMSLDPLNFEAQCRELAKTQLHAHSNPKFENLLEQMAKGNKLLDRPKSENELTERKQVLLEQAEKLKE